jgi:hypothetical protein
VIRNVVVLHTYGSSLVTAHPGSDLTAPISSASTVSRGAVSIGDARGEDPQR